MVRSGETVMSNIAHTSNRLGKRQDLLEHLHNVADTASQYCTSFIPCSSYLSVTADLNGKTPERRHRSQLSPSQKTVV